MCHFSPFSAPRHFAAPALVIDALAILWRHGPMKHTSIILAIGLLCLGGCDNKSEARKEQEALDEMIATQKNNDTVNMTEDGLVVDHEALAKRQAATEKAAATIGGVKGKALQVFADFQADSNKLAKEIDERSTAFVSALDWESLATKKDYDARRKIMTEYSQFNKDVIEVFEGRPDEISKKLDDINFKGKDRNEMEQGFNSTYKPMLPLVRGIRECDITGCEIVTRTLNLLEKDHGNWSWNADEGIINFENEATSEAYEKEMIKFDGIAKKQTDLQNRLIGKVR